VTTGDLVHAQRELYLDLAGRAQVDEAVQLCMSLLERGATPEDVTLGLLRPAQRDVGKRWALGAWSVAQEHAASAVTDAALAAISAAAPARTTGGLVAIACPSSEWHGLAARMATQLLRWRGVAADYVGTLASDDALEELLTERRPRALALSCTMTSSLPAVARAVDVAARRGTVVLGGGSGFGRSGRHARALGVAAWENDVSRVVRLLARWDTTGPPPGRRAAPEPLAYRRLLRHRDAVADQLADRLRADDADPDSQEILSDAVDQITALALAAARIGKASILDEGIRELVAVLAARGGALAAAADRLPAATRDVVTRVAQLSDLD
jgi:MerR family transcriptional regulator, light-induced transcriptional regulator